jgi:hypothetical protein
VRAGGSDDGYCLDIPILEQVRMIGVDLDATEFAGELLPPVGFLVGYGAQTGMGKALCQVARIGAAHPSQTNHAHIQET